MQRLLLMFFLPCTNLRRCCSHFFEAAFRRVMKLLEAKAAEVQKARAGALLLGTIAEVRLPPHQC